MKHRRLVATFVLVTGSLAAQTAAPPPKASLEGTVTDANSNIAIAKASVRLTKIDDEATKEGLPTQSTITDQHGHFEFRQLDAGQYQLHAYKLGYIANGYGSHRMHPPGMPLSVKDGEKIKDADIRLTRMGVIRGRITNEDGEPVVYADVLIIERNETARGSKLEEQSQVETNDRGEYRAFNLPQGDYLIACIEDYFNRSSDNDGDLLYPVTFYPNSTAIETAVPVTVRPGGETVADIKLIPTKTFHVAGKVLGAGPNSDMSVYLRRDAPLNQGYSVHGKLIGDTFEIKHVTPGDYNLVAEITEDALMAMQRITVGSHDVNDVALHLRSVRHAITGTIQAADNSRADFSKFEVEFYSLRDAQQNGGDDSFFNEGGKVRSDGSFEHILVGFIRQPILAAVHSRAPEFENWYLRSVMSCGLDVTSTGFQPSDECSDLQIILSPSGATVEGVVRDQNRRPLGGMLVTLRPDDSQIDRLDLYQSALSDQNGHFKIHQIAPGKYTLIARYSFTDEDYRDTSQDEAALLDTAPLTAEENGRYVIEVVRHVSKPQAH